jgi:YHS domain-containing protein
MIEVNSNVQASVMPVVIVLECQLCGVKVSGSDIIKFRDETGATYFFCSIPCWRFFRREGSDWDLTREYSIEYSSWCYEVSNGDTLRGFRDWFIIRYFGN